MTYHLNRVAVLLRVLISTCILILGYKHGLQEKTFLFLVIKIIISIDLAKAIFSLLLNTKLKTKKKVELKTNDDA